MKDSELIGKVHSSVYHQCQKRGFAAPVDVLMDIGVLPKEKYEDWRFGRVPFLEAICTINLRKLSFIMHQIRVYAKKANYKPSFTINAGVLRNQPDRDTSLLSLCGSARAGTKMSRSGMPPILLTRLGLPR